MCQRRQNSRGVARAFFVAWGVAHGGYLAGHAGYARRRPPAAPEAPRAILGRLRAGMAAFPTFQVVALTFVLFRARPIGDAGALSVALSYLSGLFRVANEAWSPPPIATGLALVVLLADAMIVRTASHHWVHRLPSPLRGAITAALIVLGFVLGSGDSRAFIYFQF